MLENAGHIVHFFAQLGYDVDDSLPLDHARLGMDSEDLRQQIRHIRLVGQDPKDGDIVIYLFEVRSVTVSLTQQLARRFRERPENALLVLTSDYESLDFVLVDREVAAGTRIGSGLRQIIRPRTLTVDRRNPSPVALRVLKRFTFTEADAGFQWEKLRSAFTLAEWSEQYFNNRALFSDYYLKERLTDPQLTPPWNDDVRPIGREVLRHLADARQKYSGQPERVIRQGLFEPLFASLGFEFQVSKGSAEEIEEPDYLLFAPGDPTQPIAAALTYVWNRNLDDMDPKRDPDTPNEIPGATVVSVLAKTEANWVIVSNGKLWRLYSATASNRATNYFEVDLEEAINADDQTTALKYWWLFFRRQAFTGFLDDLLQQSVDFAKALGERLKERVFTQIFPHFARGFMQKPGFSEKPGFVPADLDETFAATMTFLYRLMFILYAESLELLPVYEERGYRALSLYKLKKELAEAAGPVEDEAAARLSQHYRADSTGLYGRLQRLFQAIDRGDLSLNLPMYNGGLFSDETAEGRFLAQQAIPDRDLALGLDRLCRDVDDKTQALAFIDYKSLGVRQLGSIYEGLLEFKLRVAAEELAVVKEKGKEVYLPARKAAKKRIYATLGPGDVYLENDKRERKATGSYYTPDYIVKYIIEHTVGPVLQRKFEALEPRLREAQRLYRQHERRVEARGHDQPPELWWNRTEMKQLADDCLDIKVLDPAMGSGHFLVEAVDFVSNRLIEFLNAWSENPVWALLERTRQEILADMERQGVSIDLERLTRVALLKRSVLKRCIYGVDLNPMAVELARVSLWLDAFTLGAPLSFLDHHLKAGNSLIGARVAEVQEALGQEQMSLFAQSKFAGVMLATDLMRQVSTLSDNTVSQLEESRAAFRSAADHLAPYKRVLDVYTSRWFGNHPNVKKAGAFDPCVEFLQREDVEPWLRDPENATLPAEDYIAVRQIGETALRAAQEKRFFHWELEFPEVFFAPGKAGGQDVQLREDGGFDAVVGNPPWVDVQEIDTASKQYMRAVFRAARGKYDLYAIFVESTLGLLRGEGRHCLITQSKFLVTDYGQGLREFLAERTQFYEIVDFGDAPIFHDAATYPILLVLGLRIGDSSGRESVKVIEFPRNSRDSHISVKEALERPPDASTQVYHYEMDVSALRTGDIWSLRKPQEIALWRKVNRLSKPLGQYLSAINRSLTTGLNKAYVLSDEQIRHWGLERSAVRQLLMASDLQRYNHEYSGNYIAFPYRQNERGELEVIDLKRYPKLAEYLGALRDELENRRWYGKTVCEAGMSWYAYLYISSSILEPKLMFPKIASTTVFSWDADGDVVLLEPAYIATVKKGVEPLYLLSCVNSRLLTAHLVSQSTKLAGGFTELQVRYVQQLPIRFMELTTPFALRTQLAEEARVRYQRSLSDGFAPVLDFVAEQLAARPERSDVVHDLLAFLAEQMIELNKQKQAEVRRFLGWLEGVLWPTPSPSPGRREGQGERSIDALTGKTIIQNYLGDYQKGERELPWDDFYYRLHQNRRRFGVNLADVKGEIQAAYEASLSVLLPIKRQLAHTDALIDQIVYKLYGLTDEEIEIIERPAYEQALSQAKAAVVRDETLQQDPDAAAEAMAEKLLPAAQRLREQVALRAEREQLDRDLAGWHLFPDEVVTFLLTAEYNLRTQPDYLDFSTSVVSYAKAVEAMLYHRLFVRFRAESGATDAGCRNKFLQQFMRDERKLTLGSMSIILPSSKEPALRAFLQRLYPRAGETFFGAGGVVERLQDEGIIALRNQAAHDQTLGRQDARAARQWALGILRYL